MRRPSIRVSPEVLAAIQELEKHTGFTRDAVLLIALFQFRNDPPFRPCKEAYRPALKRWEEAK